LALKQIEAASNAAGIVRTAGGYAIVRSGFPARVDAKYEFAV
jgi:hypothetical protein